MAERRRLGRPTKRTPEIDKRLTAALRAGMSIRHAAAYAGIGEATYHEWSARFPEFAERFATVRAEHALTNLLLIQKAAADGDWRAAEAALRLSHTSEYGRKVLEVEQDTTIHIDVAAARAELDALLGRASLRIVDGENVSHTKESI